MTDPLDRFTAALAATYDGQVAVPSVTRARIAQKLTRRRKRRSGWRVLLAIPLFALVGGTALAATGQLPLGAFASLAAWFEDDAREQPAPAAFSSPAGARAAPVASPSPAGAQAASVASSSPTSAQAASVASSSPTSAQAASVASSSPTSAQEKTNVRSLSDLAATDVPVVMPAPASRSAASRSAGSRSAGSRSASSRSASSHATPAQVAASQPPRGEPALTTYAAAQRAQFREGNCSAAIGQYEAYLRQAPSGALVAEARYNRSLCLIRLGRIAEARPALDAFARGDFGSYRRMEASRLLRALEKR